MLPYVSAKNSPLTLGVLAQACSPDRAAAFEEALLVVAMIPRHELD